MQEPRLHNEQELLSALSLGSEDAFTEIFNAYRDRIYHTALHHTGDKAAAEEVVQDVFLQLWLKRANATTIENLQAYLHGIATHVIYRAWKRTATNRERNAQNLPPETLLSETPAALLEHKDHEQILHEAIQRLPEKQRLTYQLIRQQGMTREQAAAELNVSPETIKSNLDHALRNIRAFCLARIGISTAILALLDII